MTVSQLRKSLKGLSGKLPVYTADHDHSTYGTNSIVGTVQVVDHKNMSEWERNQHRRDGLAIIKGKYLVIRP